MAETTKGITDGHATRGSKRHTECQNNLAAVCERGHDAGARTTRRVELQRANVQRTRREVEIGMINEIIKLAPKLNSDAFPRPGKVFEERDVVDDSAGTAECISTENASGEGSIHRGAAAKGSGLGGQAIAVGVANCINGKDQEHVWCARIGNPD